MGDRRMVPGAAVVCKRCGCIGTIQLINLTSGCGVVRLFGSGEVLKLEKSELRLVTPEELRTSIQGNSSTGCARITSTTQPASLNGL